MKIRKGDIEIEVTDVNEALAIVSALKGGKRQPIIREETRPRVMLRAVNEVPRPMSTRVAPEIAEAVPVLASDHPLGWMLLRALVQSKAGSIHGFRTMKRLGVVEKPRGMGTLAKDLRVLAHEAGIDAGTVYYNKHTSGRYFLLQGGADLFKKVSSE